jgi:cytochrome c
MKNKIFSGKILILLGVLSLLSTLGFATEPPQTDQAKQTIVFVDKAAALLSSKGKAAFPEFKIKDGNWWKDDTYIYVFDINGTLMMHPIYSIYEGQNLTSIRDIHLKAFVQQATDIAKTKGSGWFDFMLPRPGQTLPTHKYAYIETVKIPDGQTLVVGSGFWVK